MITKIQIGLTAFNVGTLQSQLTGGIPEPTVYVLALTDAPKDYDGFGTIEVRAFDYPLELSEHNIYTKGNARLVLIRSEHLEWHQGRYGSGMHCCYTENLGEVFQYINIPEILSARLTHATPNE